MPEAFFDRQCFSKYSTAECPDLKMSHALVTVLKDTQVTLKFYNSLGQEDPAKKNPRKYKVITM